MKHRLISQQTVTLKSEKGLDFSKIRLYHMYPEGGSPFSSLFDKVFHQNHIYVIGIDTYDKNSLTYSLSRNINGTVEFILIKTMRDEIKFHEEVDNLAKYFNAEIFKEKTYETSSKDSPRYQVDIEEQKAPDKDQGDVPKGESQA